MSDNAAILIVDDRPEKILAIEVVLEELGHEIVRAYSGREALRLVLQREFAVILLDVNMPGMDGFETAAMIRQRKSSEHVPIIFVTSFGDEMHAARSYSLGAVDYILAPVVPDVLRSKVGVFVDLYTKNAQLRRQADSLRRRATQLQKLAAASVAINSGHTLEDTVRTITDTARDVIGAHQAITLFVGDPGGLAVKAFAMASFSDRYGTWRDKPLPVGPLSETLVARLHKPLRVTEAELKHHPDYEVVSKLSIPPIRGGVLAAPLLGREGRRWGILYLTDPEIPSEGFGGGFSYDDEALLTQLAQMGSITVENVLSAHEREANRLKDQFLATLSHELRTPLNAMLGWTEILRLEQCSEEVSHGLEVIERNVLAQTRLVDDLLDVSRINTGKLKIVRKAISLPAVVEAAVDSVRPQATDKQIHLHVVINPLPPSAGDPDRLQQVIWNLLANAVKFTPNGGRIQVTLEQLNSPNGPIAQFKVTDNGRGIDPHFLPHVFDRFRQADSSSTRRHGGLGIGLTIVRHIVEAHNGTVHAASAGEGAGSTFTIQIPLALEEQAHTAGDIGAASAEKRSSPQSALAGLALVVVEDEPDARQLMVEILRRSGATVNAFANVRDAMVHLQHHLPDVIVSDIAMPDEDGYSFIRRVRQLPPAKGGNIPAIAVTAFAREEDRARIIASGFQYHVPKPISAPNLLATIESAAAQSPAHRAAATAS